MKKIRASLIGIYPHLKELDETTFKMATLHAVFSRKYRASEGQTEKFFKAAQKSGAVVGAGFLYGVPMYRMVYDFTMDI
jgi:tRNA splicing endonuclease